MRVVSQNAVTQWCTVRAMGPQQSALGPALPCSFEINWPTVSINHVTKTYMHKI